MIINLLSSMIVAILVGTCLAFGLGGGKVFDHKLWIGMGFFFLTLLLLFILLEIKDMTEKIYNKKFPE